MEELDFDFGWDTAKTRLELLTHIKQTRAMHWLEHDAHDPNVPDWWPSGCIELPDYPEDHGDHYTNKWDIEALWDTGQQQFTVRAYPIYVDEDYPEDTTDTSVWIVLVQYSVDKRD
jgi:hypothetical protein